MNPPGQLKAPLDPFPYPQDSRSRPADGQLGDGLYAYARDELGIVVVIPDGPHVHPKILGRARPALYAGDLTIRNGTVLDLTNLSGTFQFADEPGLLGVAAQLELHGLTVNSGAVRFFPADGSAPRTLG